MECHLLSPLSIFAGVRRLLNRANYPPAYRGKISIVRLVTRGWTFQEFDNLRRTSNVEYFAAYGAGLTYARAPSRLVNVFSPTVNYLSKDRDGD